MTGIISSPKKYRSEKVLHEVIRDLPEAQHIDRMLVRGCITVEEALRGIADAIAEERRAAAARS